MSFKPKRKQPRFADLKGILSQTRNTENPLYQTVEQIIERLTQFQSVVNNEIGGKLEAKDVINKFATNFATYVTQADESIVLPNSFQLIAGLGVTFDLSIPHQLKIQVSGGYAPLSTGAEPLEIMSDGAGSVLMVGFSE